MMPISLGCLWIEPSLRVICGQNDLKQLLVERNYSDFTDESLYQESLQRLLKGLERDGDQDRAGKAD